MEQLQEWYSNIRIFPINCVKTFEIMQLLRIEFSLLLIYMICGISYANDVMRRIRAVRWLSWHNEFSEIPMGKIKSSRILEKSATLNPLDDRRLLRFCPASIYHGDHNGHYSYWTFSVDSRTVKLIWGFFIRLLVATGISDYNVFVWILRKFSCLRFLICH
ncbi:hypothetical protein OUZ56_019965 [Daphnia magna]|uniref:Transmembrane protein n=1 Tax=Daphnia magna TaxID=35525 RepID=A0ABQ9ZD62_9CRUS|nr:hypothetical protein OUZ56_019965 [Daphnia magna]